MSATNSNRLYSWLQSLASKKWILILFLLAHAVLLVMMTVTFPRINSQMGNKAFDLQTFGYSHEDAVVMLGNLDQETTEIYVFPQLLLLDVLYPLLLALLLSALIIRLQNLMDQSSGYWRSKFHLLPFLGMIFDYIENVLILYMLHHKDDVSELLVTVASSATLLKGICTLLCWLLVLVLFLSWVLSKRKTQKSN